MRAATLVALVVNEQVVVDAFFGFVKELAGSRPTVWTGYGVTFPSVFPSGAVSLHSVWLWCLSGFWLVVDKVIVALAEFALDRILACSGPAVGPFDALALVLLVLARTAVSCGFLLRFLLRRLSGFWFVVDRVLVARAEFALGGILACSGLAVGPCDALALVPLVLARGAVRTRGVWGVRRFSCCNNTCVLNEVATIILPASVGIIRGAR
jgi:hypothetical protein